VFVYVAIIGVELREKNKVIRIECSLKKNNKEGDE